ncbi:meiotically up-regulated 190 protein [Diaporthe helianthi]|uniref:Meiotically up-regulated 190 protein n=1 Tax=Diaporthe helianthi TaxID=158607 RepID=A0A2P5I0B5_DIAHE|nr:meiotically up-regulated 190 protein [Diaporthe helianthi]
MDQQQQTAPGGHYSGTNRIPNIKQFMEGLDKDKKERDAKIDAQHTGGGEGKPHRTETSKGNNRRTVRDPVTGKDVEIDDIGPEMVKAVDDPHLFVPNANLGKETTVKTDHTQSGEEYRRNQDITAPPDPVEPGTTSDVPIHGEKTNVLFHPTPSVSYEPMYSALEARANVLCAGIFFSIAFIGKILGGSLWGLIPLGFCVASGVFLWVKDLIRQGRDTEWSSEQQRGETAVVNLIPESVEWMNTAIGLIWSLINPDMFAAVADTLEDVMQASVPGVIENVKVNDISQGSNPIRVLSLRALPDSHVQDLKDEIRKQDEKTKDPQELAADEEGGDFYNLEATIAYHSLPSGTDVSSKAKNMGMQLVFYLGMKGLFGVPFPIWVELNGLVCTARLRVALAPNPPFIKTLSVTLMGLPRVEASCIPLIEKGANVLNLPVISNFVNWAIATAAGMYVAPKSLTLDIGKMLSGDDITKETQALGVLFIRIHKATGLSKQDRRGSEGGGSDPYICVAFSKFGKPQYCTRVIQDNLDPIFSECAALLVTPDIIKADEQLSLELWDSDRSSADDVVGKVELSIQKLIQHPGRMFPQQSTLRGTKAESTMPGTLSWEVGFFGKTQYRTALRTDGKDPNLPKELQDKKELQQDVGSLDTANEDAVVHTPPDPLWPSGIVSVVVHQIVNLELENVKGSEGKRKGREFEPARPEAGDIKEETGKKLPSSYCTILINDELAYKTRTKVVSSKPIFEAGTERFIRDWRAAIITITVRDSRNRQHDPIIGVVPLKLSDILLTSSQVTRWYPLDGGIGFGRVRISLLFRSVDLRLPPQQLGFGEIGTFEFLSDTLKAVNYGGTPRTKIKLRTGGSSAAIKSEKCTPAEDGSLVWDITESQPRRNADGTTTNVEGHIRLPVRYRYRSPVFFEFHPAGKRHTDTYASVWLQDLIDFEEKDFDIPIWRCNNGTRLSQNYITEANYRDVPNLKIEEIGRLRFRGRFKPGTDRDHLKFVSDNDSRETIESWEACYAEGVRKELVVAEVPPSIQKLHDASLTQGRDVLDQAHEKDKEKWLAKDGTDWSGAFGKDPLEMIGKSRGQEDGTDSDEDQYDDEDSSNPDLGITDATTGPSVYDGGDANGDQSSTGARQSVDSDHGSQLSDQTTKSSSAKSNSSKSPIKALKDYRTRSRDLHRQHRGLMQWKPMRNVQFAKDEATFAIRRITKVGSLSGRKPDVETEV